MTDTSSIPKEGGEQRRRKGLSDPVVRRRRPKKPNGDARPEPRAFTVTIWESVTARKPMGEDETTLAGLQKRMLATKAATKTDLPLLKFARFGDRRSDKGSLRHDANVLEISGIEVEHDAEQMGFDEAAEKLTAAGLCCLLYTTPSHTPDQPRWRVLLPCSTMLPPDERAQLVARINGVLGGVLSGESFALSQIFYFGHIEGSETFRVELVAGDFIDLRPDLDDGAIDKPAATGGNVDAKALEEYLKSQVDWLDIYGCGNLGGLKKNHSLLWSRVERRLDKEDGALAHRWNGGIDGLKERPVSRSARDFSLVGILRTMEFSITEAITIAVAWGNSNPQWGRGSDKRDKEHREIDWERYWVRAWMRPDDRLPKTLDELPPTPPVQPPAGKNPFPDICRKPPGAVGELVDYFSRAMTRVVPDELLVPMALAVVAFAAQNRFLAGNINMQTPVQVYAAIVAKTGLGKTDLGKAAMRLLEGSAAQKGIVEALASGPALLTRLGKLEKSCPYGPTMLFVMDELGLKLQARTGKSSNSHVKDLVDEVISLYGRGNSTHAGKGYADEKKDITPIEHPNVSVVGFTTERPLIEALTGADATAGLVNRFLLAPLADVGTPQKRYSEIDQTIPAGLARHVARIGDPSLRFSSEPKDAALQNLQKGLENLQATLPHAAPRRQTRLPFDRHAEARIDAITDELNRLANRSDDLGEAIWNRARQQVIGVAAILVIGQIDTDAEERPVPTIRREHVDWAWELVRWSTRKPARGR